MDYLKACPKCGKDEALSIEDRIGGRAFEGRVVCNFFKGGCGFASEWENNLTDVMVDWNLLEREK